MTYKQHLDAAKNRYPFTRWKNNYNEGLLQYTADNCHAVQLIFDSLIASLTAIGEQADKAAKELLFRTAVLSLNILNDGIAGLIETGEREDLCELIDEITRAAGLNPADYGEGEGIADEWRKW